jgi:phenylacetate-CoA ligase
MILKLQLADTLRKTNAISLYRNELSQSQFLSREDLAALQWTRLEKILEHAYHNVPYYQKIFKELRITPRDIQHPGDLKKLPVLTKEKIRKNYHELLAVNQRQYKPRMLTSGGSTGEPLRFYIDALTNGYQWADVYRGQIMAGWNFGEKMGRFWGSSVLSIQKPLQKRVYSWLNDWVLFPAFNSGEDMMRTWIDAIRRQKIRYLSGYVDTMVDFARFVIANRLQTQLTAVFPTTAPLTPSGRRIIQKAFGCGIFDLYQSADGGLSSIECHQHQGLHISEERCLVETPDDAGEHDIPAIVTDLFNYAMPFIRYENGDEITTTREPCQCGRESKIIRRVRGKTYHQILLPNGRKVHSEIFSYYLNNFLVVKHFLARQTSQSKIVLEIELDNQYKSEIGLLEKSLIKLPLALPGFKIEYSYVQEIDKMPNQKYSLFVPYNPGVLTDDD